MRTLRIVLAPRVAGEAGIPGPVVRLLLLLLLLITTPPCVAAQNKGLPPNKHQTLQLAAFSAKAAVELPPDFLENLAREIPKELTRTKRFREVLSGQETSADPAAPALEMTGTVVDFAAGNRAARWIEGDWGRGAAVVVAHVKLTDKATGEILFEMDVTGRLTRGILGGSANGAARELAREIARLLGKRQF